jgi:hypothetical protein
MPTREQLLATLAQARGAVEENLLEARDPDNDTATQAEARQAAFGQACVVEMFAQLIGVASGYDLTDLGWLA